MQGVLSVLIDGFMTVLLLATIVYCVKLNRRIRVLQDSKSDLARIIREFDVCTTRATQNINEIHAATSRLNDNLQLKIDKANFVANDLDMLIERGGKVTGKPDATGATSSRVARTPDPAPRAKADAPPTAEAHPQRMRSRAEQDLLNLLGKKQNT